MQIEQTTLPGLRVITPKVFADARGHFFESWNQRAFAAAGIDARFVQDNQSQSAHNVLRGLHYQIRQAQGKLVRCVSGAVFDVAVDLRRQSPAFGRWFGIALTAENRTTLWIPPGFAHGFLVTTEQAEVLYKVTELWAPEHERTLRWDDPEIGIAWPLDGPPVVSAKDAAGASLRDAETFARLDGPTDGES